MNLKTFFQYKIKKIYWVEVLQLAIFEESSVKKWDTNLKVKNWENGGLVVNNKFIVTIGPLLTSFSKVSGIGRSVEYETKEEGGRNDIIHVFRKNVQYQNNILRLEKGVGRYNPLVLAADGTIEMGVRIPLPGTIIILNDNYQMSQMYTFDDIVILKWELSDLDAKGDEVILDRVEIMHSGLKMVKV